MGLCGPSSSKVKAATIGSVKASKDGKRVFKALRLSDSDVKQLWRQYKKLDTSHDGTLSLGELLDALNQKRTPFTKRSFQVMDEDGNGVVDFKVSDRERWDEVVARDDHHSLTAHHSALTAHHSPPTTHEGPLTTRRSPLTTHHSPLAPYRS